MGKLYLITFAVIFLAMITIPFISMSNVTSENTVHTKKSEIIQSENKNKDDTVKILSGKKVINVTLTEYLTGVCMTEMDESYPDEAIKAQAVAAHTLLLYKKEINRNKDYDITDDYSVDQGYLDTNARKKKYKDIYEKTEKRIEKLVKSVKNKIIYYNNKPILAVYHDTSGGKTENAKDIWGGDYPYLKSVDSISDMLNPQYLSTVTYTKAEFLSILKGLNGSLPNKESEYIGKSQTTDSGTVKKIIIGKNSYTGDKIREAFSLRSANFDLNYENKKFSFTVRGFGHGVGMSQYGASFMAKEGSSYEEILNWYYKNCKING